MCLRFHPKEHHILLAGTSEGLIFLCNTQDGTVTEKITGKNRLRYICENNHIVIKILLIYFNF